REALIHRATNLALCHNHPSGNTSPSIDDERLTNKVQQASKLMNITLIDHLIVCDGSYFSFADEGKL
ncbi:MAG: JAB domain-containing protein, partial [Bacteroidaceae bacterium]